MVKTKHDCLPNTKHVSNNTSHIKLKLIPHSPTTSNAETRGDIFSQPVAEQLYHIYFSNSYEESLRKFQASYYDKVLCLVSPSQTPVA